MLPASHQRRHEEGGNSFASKKKIFDRNYENRAEMLLKWYEIMCWNFKNPEHQAWPARKRGFDSNQKKKCNEIGKWKLNLKSVFCVCFWLIQMICCFALDWCQNYFPNNRRWTMDWWWNLSVTLCCVPDLFAWWWWWQRRCRWWWFYLAVTSCLHPPSLHPCPFSWRTKPCRRDLRDVSDR